MSRLVGGSWDLAGTAVVGLMLAGCGRAALPLPDPAGPSPGDRADLGTRAGGDLGPGGPVDGGADLAPPDERGVVCGEARCASSVDQFCDTADYGVTGTCRAQTAPMDKGYGCDGPEDCAAEACCELPVGSACSGFGFCVSGDVKGRWMCHDDSTCGFGWVCCPIAPPSSYRVCEMGSCPP